LRTEGYCFPRTKINPIKTESKGKNQVSEEIGKEGEMGRGSERGREKRDRERWREGGREGGK
jgi:hypothetical protein